MSGKPRRAGGKPQPDDGLLPSPRDLHADAGNRSEMRQVRKGRDDPSRSIASRGCIRCRVLPGL